MATTTSTSTSPSSTPTNSNENKRALLLGMVYSKETNPSRGQGYRDRIRCESLEETANFIVDTLDNKHDEILAKAGHHCRANFADHKRMFKDLKLIWNFDGTSPRYDTIILDYFFSPAGWVNTRWTENFFLHTIPLFRTNNLLKESGTIWLPNNSYVQEMLIKHDSILSKIYQSIIIQDPKENPLYKATDNVRENLLLCPDNITNETQIPYLISSPGGPFVCLIPKNNSINLNQTNKLPKKKKEKKNNERSLPAPSSSSSLPSSLPTPSSSSLPSSSLSSSSLPTPSLPISSLPTSSSSSAAATTTTTSNTANSNQNVFLSSKDLFAALLSDAREEGERKRKRERERDRGGDLLESLLQRIEKQKNEPQLPKRKNKGTKRPIESISVT